MITNRIRENFYKVYDQNRISVHFDTADLANMK